MKKTKTEREIKEIKQKRKEDEKGNTRNINGKEKRRKESETRIKKRGNKGMKETKNKGEIK